MILLKRNLDIKVKECYKDNEGRILTIQCEFQDEEFLLTNIYAPNVDSPSFYLKVISAMENIECHKKMLAGDFNLTLEPGEDRKNTFTNNNRSLQVLRTYIEETDLCDIWRTQNPDKKAFTWHRGGDLNTASRIDMFLISSNMISNVTDSCIKPGYKSDHSVVTLLLQFAQNIRGKGTWKINNNYLNCKDYKELINRTINTVIVETRIKDPIEIWEAAKNAVINDSIAYSIVKAKEKRKAFNEIYDQLFKLVSEESPRSESVLKAKYELENFIQEKTKSIIFRSKANWHLHGERSSKYFFALEKSNYNKKLMKAIRLKDNSISREDKTIMKEQAMFYRKLYKSNPDVHFLLKNETDIRLSEEQKTKLDADVTLAELTTALHGLPANKTPGLDGLTCEFYKVFWDKLGPVYHHMILYSVRRGSLNETARKGLIQLIPKKQKDLLLLDNW